jgi:tripartite-type tricarboxylate transporter receptor subunit TctC
MRNRTPMRNTIAILLAAPLVAAGSVAAAQDYPTQAITLIVPYSPGGGGDTVARIVADRLGEELGQTINVVNREGAGGEIGIAEMARAEADGYTLGVFGYPDNVVLEQTRETDFDFDSFEHLAGFDLTPMGMFAAPGAPFDDLEGLREYAEANPGAVVVGESGALGLLAILAFGDELGVDLTPIRYDGGGELMNAVLGNHIEMASTSSMSHDPITDANGTPIGFFADERMDMFPDVPTFAEQGVDLEMGVGRVLVAPAGIPDDVRDRLTEALDAMSEDEAMINRFETAALPYQYRDHDAVNEWMETQNETFIRIIEENRDQFEGS